MTKEEGKHRMSGRSEFLRRLSAVAAASPLAMGRTSGAQEQKTSAAVPLPTIRLGQHDVTRLVAGWNPIGGYSYMGPNMDRGMKEYFTAERTVEFLLQCEREGINCHQFSHPKEMTDIFRTLRQRGSKMKLICLHDRSRGSINSAIELTGPIAMVHHGGVTDSLFRKGKSQEVHDYVKEAHDQGVLAGVSAHNPDAIKQIADEGWEVDLFMNCFYYITRKEPPSTSAGTLPVLQGPDVGYTFYQTDPKAMCEVIRQTPKTCLAFKILAAGRNCATQQDVLDAFGFAFDNIKKQDAVVVGVFPKYIDQVSLNVQYMQNAVSKNVSS